MPFLINPSVLFTWDTRLPREMDKLTLGTGEGRWGSPCSWKNTIPVRGRGSVATVCSGGAGPKSNMWMASLNKERHIYCPSCLEDLGWADLFGFPFTNEVQYALKKITMWINWKEIAWLVRNSQNSNSVCNGPFCWLSFLIRTFWNRGN